MVAKIVNAIGVFTASAPTAPSHAPDNALLLAPAQAAQAALAH